MILKATFPNDHFTIASEVWLEISNIKQKIVKKVKHCNMSDTIFLYM